ncbi:NADH-quinone oxidoreductase subunit J [Ohtaekwangia kribbensis]|uniref:NADH-quinone oxidoreductase subunit J n=1 Tax=Ohtaekwangia kribbensis TaxID=688913 RepID=A0ABW3K0K1_9BACT
MTLNAFYFLSFLAIMSAIMVVLSKNPVYSVLYLIITFFCIAGHYTLMNAQFLAIVHIIVYAGAIMVLFLYVIMLLNLNKESEPHKSNVLKFAATICAGLIMLVLIGSLKGTENMLQQQPAAADIGLVKTLGKVMFTEFLLPFEITSVLLLAAMVGAVMLGKPESR